MERAGTELRRVQENPRSHTAGFYTYIMHGQGLQLNCMSILSHQILMSKID